MEENSLKNLSSDKQVLVVEDDIGFQELIIKMLTKEGYKAFGVCNGNDAIKQIVVNNSVLVLLDNTLPDMSGQEIISSLALLGIKANFIVMTGQGDERLAVEMMKLGAADYLAKDVNLIDILPGVINRVFHNIETENRLQAAEEMLRETEKYSKLIFEHSQSIFYTISPEGFFTYVSPSWEKLLGHKPNDVVGQKYTDFISAEDIPQDYDILQAIAESCQVHNNIEYRAIHQNNSYIWHRSVITPVFDENNMLLMFVGNAIDISERKQTEEALLNKTNELEYFFTSALDLLCIADMEGNFIRVSNEWENTLGYTIDELENSKFLDFVHPDDLQDTLDVLNKLSNKENILNFTNRYLSKNGAYRFIEWRSTPQGKFIYAAARDITERMEAQEELNEKRRFLEDIIENSGTIIVTKDRFGKYTLVNKKWEEATGLKRENVLGKTDDMIFSSVDAEAFKKNDQNVIESNKLIEMEETLNTPVGLKYYLSIKFPIRDTRGIVTGICGMISDITERKKVEDALRESEENQRKINSEKDKFFSIIAHDLRSPFQGFIGLTKMMTENIENISMKDMKEFSQNMQNSANMLYRLLENLLQWSKIQRGLLDFNPESINITQVINMNISIAKEHSEQKDIAIVNCINEELEIYADLQMIDTVIRNLISNAIKFSYRGGIIEIGNIYTYEDNTCIYIKDSGMGMDDALLNNLFKLDKKVSRLGTENELSSGLGLILCKEFIEKHNGKIWAESKINEGSTFFFTLPMNN
ncbi:MAG TPA: PAS domain S-box protein [Candidatus Kapabacteria bacterium]|nr:PAS domain S-box protein [Candidatus Kapabacteria bacterium]